MPLGAAGAAPTAAAARHQWPPMAANGRQWPPMGAQRSLTIGAWPQPPARPRNGPPGLRGARYIVEAPPASVRPQTTLQIFYTFLIYAPPKRTKANKYHQKHELLLNDMIFREIISILHILVFFETNKQIDSKLCVYKAKAVRKNACIFG